MIDVFDIVAFVLFGGILAVTVQVVVTLGSLPGRIAQKREHPQAAAIAIASWLGLATLVLGAVVASGAEAISCTAMGCLWPASDAISSRFLNRSIRRRVDRRIEVVEMQGARQRTGVNVS